MKYCASCGVPLEEGAKFCTTCGASVEESKSESSKIEVSKMNTSAEFTDEKVNSTDSKAIKEQLTETFEQTKQTVEQNGYVNYLKETLKRPFKMIESDHSYYGWLQFVMVSILFTLSLYFYLRGKATTIYGGNNYGYNYEFDYMLSDIHTNILPRVFILVLVGNLIFPAITSLALKRMAKIEISFNRLLNQLGGLFTPYLVVLAISAVLMILLHTTELMSLSTLLLFSSGILPFVGLDYYLFETLKDTKEDTYFILLFVNLAIVLVLFIMFYLQFDAFRGMIFELNLLW